MAGTEEVFVVAKQSGSGSVGLGVLGRGGHPHLLETAWCPGERWLGCWSALGYNLYEVLQRNRTDRLYIDIRKDLLGRVGSLDHRGWEARCSAVCMLEKPVG